VHRRDQGKGCEVVSARQIVAFLWDGPVTIGYLTDGQPEPSPETLAALQQAYAAAGCEGFAKVRVVSTLVIPQRSGVGREWGSHDGCGP
jgi:hypothetical protein